jgi:uroporphyrinogen-III synthase
MDKTILITRPKGDELGLTNALQDNGYRVIHEPLMDIVLRHQERYNVFRAISDDPDAVLVTSRHGVRALAILTDIRDMFVICVGESTAKAALAAGFTRVSSAGGNARLLMQHVLASYDEGARFLYISGDHVRVDLSQALGQAGMRVERIVAYESLAAEQLSDTLIEQLRRRQIDAVSFLSQRTAEIFLELLEKHEILDSVRELRAFCMSEAVADALEEWPWKSIHVSPDASLVSLVNSIDNVFVANG